MTQAEIEAVTFPNSAARKALETLAKANATLAAQLAAFEDAVRFARFQHALTGE
jgi:hypothetical protein